MAAQPTYKPCMQRLMLAIGKYFIDEGEDPAEWVSFTYISKESSLWDFGLSEEEKNQIFKDLDLPYDDKGNLGEIVEQMKARGDYNG